MMGRANPTLSPLSPARTARVVAPSSPPAPLRVRPPLLPQVGGEGKRGAEGGSETIG
jgi:hypothetical protein